MIQLVSRSVATAAIVLFYCVGIRPVHSQYDPLSKNLESQIKTVDFEIQDSKRKREIPVRVFLSSNASPSPLILFSHGLGGSKNNNPYLGNHWSSRGYTVIFVQHHGSDEYIWKDAKIGDKLRAMRSAVTAENALLRCDDIGSVIDQVEIWNESKEHSLFNRMDLSKIGMCGHSFGAQTTQSVSGQSFPLVGQKYNDNRISAALAFSPGAPLRGGRINSFSRVTIPWFLMTGTNDTAAIVSEQTVESRLEVYKSLPNTIDKFELVLDKAEHSAFGDRPLPGDKESRNPNHHKAILAMSTAFWDCYLKNSTEAKTWLTSDSAKQILEEGDKFQWNLAK